MINKNLLFKVKKYFPFVFILFVWFIFSSPYFLQNKVPFASSYLVNFFSPWNSYSGFAGPVKNNAMSDVISQIYPWKNLTIDAYRNLEVPLWNPYSFSGTVHLANYQSAVFSPLNLLFFILPFLDAWSVLVLLQPLFAAVFMYLYLKSQFITKISALCGAVAFMFCGFITTWMGYATLSYAILFLPLCLFAIEKFYYSKKFRYLFLLSLSIFLSFTSGHFQISLYLLIFVFLYSIYKIIETRDLAKGFYTIFYIIIGLLLSCPQIIPSIEAYSYSLRSVIFQKTEIIPWGYISTFFAPDFLGNPVTRNDWFGHYAEWNAFVGTSTIILSLYSIFFIKNKKIFFFIFTAILAIFLSFPSPLINLVIFLKIPVLSTSAASRIIVLFSFSIIVLASFSIDFITTDLIKRKLNNIIYWLVFVALIFGSLWAIVVFKLVIPIDKIGIAKQNLILPSLIAFTTCLLLFSGYLLSRFRSIKPFIFFIPSLILLVFTFDMLRFSTKWQPFDQRSLAFPSIPIVKEFNQISGFNRVIANMGGEANIYYKLPSLEGYDAVYSRRYGELISSVDSGKLSSPQRSVVTFPRNGLYSKKFVDLLGVKYVIHKFSDGRNLWAYPFWKYPNGAYTQIYNDGAYEIYKNNDVLPRTFLANSYIVANSSERIVAKIIDSKTNLRKTLILEKDPKFKLDIKNGNAKIEKYKYNSVEISTTSDGNSLLFLSDAYYPGWKAFVDGKNTPIYRANFDFRAIQISKGTHKVLFKYEPFSFTLGVVAAVLGVIFMITGAIFRKRIILFPRI